MEEHLRDATRGSRARPTESREAQNRHHHPNPEGRLRSMKAFQHFDRTLGAEHRRKTEAEIEAGVAEPPKQRKPGTGRPRKSTPPIVRPPRLSREGKATVE